MRLSKKMQTKLINVCLCPFPSPLTARELLSVLMAVPSSSCPLCPAHGHRECAQRGIFRWQDRRAVDCTAAPLLLPVSTPRRDFRDVSNKSLQHIWDCPLNFLIRASPCSQYLPVREMPAFLLWPRDPRVDVEWLREARTRRWVGNWQFKLRCFANISTPKILFGIRLSLPPPFPNWKRQATIRGPKSSCGQNGVTLRKGKLISWLPSHSPSSGWRHPTLFASLNSTHCQDCIFNLNIWRRIKKAWGKKVTLHHKWCVSAVHRMFYFCFWIKDRTLIKK